MKGKYEFRKSKMTTASNSRILRIIPLLVIMILFCPTAESKIISVDDNKPADFSTIQAAIDDSNDGDTVLVAPGTYTGEGNRDIDFKGKAITVKSEEGPETCIIDCQGSEDDFHRGFYFHTNEDANSIIQGITITNGFVGDGGAIFFEGSSPTICECIIRSNTAQVQYGMDYEGSGGGIYCNHSEALIKDCIIIDNSANPRWLHVPQGGRGGGVYCSNSNLTITGCEISNNSSALDQSGAVYCWTSNIKINACISNDNQSNGIYMYRSNLEITDSLIANNKCSGITCSESNEAIVKNCDILKNRREGLDFYNIEDILIDRCLITANIYSGIDCSFVDRLSVNNCTITNNRGRGIYSRAINCNISNSIIWENRILLSPSSILDNPLCTISYSNVQGALESVGIVEGYSLNWGEGNINLDPNFASPGHWDPNGIPWTYEDDIWVDGDYHLKSQAGRWNPNSQNWILDDVTSPCIDAGDPNSPIDSEPFPNGGIINMGAYGGTAEASKSLSEKSIYIFWPQQSMVFQTGGIAGVNGAYILTGQFQLTIDLGAGKARFSNVEAIATDFSEPVRKLDPNDVFNLTGLTGTIRKDGSIKFTGRTADESNVLLYLTLSDELISLKGQTTPPPNSADFFIFDLDAVALRKYGGGTGELNDPYLIYTSDQLNTIGAEPNDWDKNFKLMADIDLSGYSYDAALIAPDVDPCDPGFQGISFTGVLDGNGHKISNLTITSGDYVGLLGQTELGAEIKDLGITDVNITGSDYVGGFVGFSKGNISTSYCTGTISGDQRVGGITGRNWSNNITACYSTAKITANSDAGGIAANNYGSITNCYNTGAISSYRDAAGLVGENYGTIDKCYSVGAVSGDSRSGGLVSANWQDSIITSSFWNTQTSGQSTSDGGTGKTTAEMQTASIFLEAGWDFVNEIENGTEDIWWIREGLDYPKLWWEESDL